jgi:hypothetical protein
MIDYSTKEIYLKAYKEKGIIVLKIVKVIRREVIRLYRVPNKITLDKGN